jgi:hypothetical protein
MFKISQTQKAVSFFMILMLSTGWAMFSVERNAQGYTSEAKGRLYYQAAFESFGTEPATLPKSLTLLGAGAKWAAGNGTRALVVDWYDNYLAHYNTDGVNWGPWPSEEEMKNVTFSISYVLNQSGLSVELAGDIPSDLSGYDLVVLSAYWAVEPRDCSLIENYLANGGGVVLLVGIPEYFRCYCKDWWTYRCAISNESLGMEQWFGNGTYVNSGGDASITVDNPFSTGLKSGDILMQNCGGSNAAVVSADAEVVATWGNGSAFAFAREYGQGRLYYQAAFESLDPPNKPGPVGDVAGDYNGIVQGLPDGKVDMRDISYLVRLFNTKPDSPKWNPMADINGDNIINMREITIAVVHFNQHN